MKMHRFLSAWMWIILLSATTAFAETAHVTDDATINLDQPTENLGLAEWVRVGVFLQATTSNNYHGFVRFSDSKLPSDASISSATLRLWVVEVANGGSFDVHPVLDPWQELALSAAAPPTLDTSIATVAISEADKWNFVTIDITELVQEWVSGTRPNNGIALVPSGLTGVLFGSKEHHDSAAPSHLMALDIAPIGPKGEKGDRGERGEKGEKGDPGPAVRTVAVCTITRVRTASPLCSTVCQGSGRIGAPGGLGPCTVTSDTGSCTAPGAGAGDNPVTGLCCVCKP